MENQNNNPLHKRQGKDTANKSKATELNPQFEDLKQAETFLSHIEELQRQTDENYNPFPVDIFPEAVQDIITATNECLNFPTDFTGSSMLYAAAVAIGNTHRVEIKSGWQESSCMFLAIVGRAGTNKSHPLSFALQPINHNDDQRYKEYEKEKMEFVRVSDLSKAERKKQGLGNPTKPVWKQSLVNDFTPEALADVHKFNKRGIGVYVDELATWFNNFNRYNKGSEEQFWLSVWNGKGIRINRKTSEPTNIPMPFIPVIGTIQPGVLKDLAYNRTENGFLDRLLFAYPHNLKKEYWSEEELDPEISKNWHTIISRLLDIPLHQDRTCNPKPEVLRFTSEAKQLLYDWQRKLTDESNNRENEAICGINAKMEMYAARFALLLQMMRYACGEDDKKAVTAEAMKGALKLAEYFKRTAIKVHNIVSNASPLNKLPTDKQNLYNELPEKFTTGEGVTIAKSLGIAERTFKHFISNRDLFTNPKRGEYEKRI